jgi:hypothetical protein
MTTFATIDDIKKLSEKIVKATYYSHSNEIYTHHLVEARKFSACPPEEINNHLGFPAHLNVRVVHVTNHDRNFYYDWSGKAIKHGDDLDKKPVLVSVVKDAYQRDVKRFHVSESLAKLAKTARDPHFLGEAQGGYAYQGGRGNANVAVSVEMEGHRFFVIMPFDVAERAFGLELIDGMKIQLPTGENSELEGWEGIIKGITSHYRGGVYKRDAIKGFDFTFDTLGTLVTMFGFGKRATSRFLANLVTLNWISSNILMDGIKKTWDRLAPVTEELRKVDALAYCSYRSLASASKRSIDGVKVASVFNDMFKDVTDAKGIQEKMKDFWGDSHDNYDGFARLEESIKELPIYKEKRKAVLKGQANRAITKIMQDSEALTIDKKKHKLTWAEIEAGNLPIGTFFRKSEQYFILNDNWDLWEEMFKQGHREVALELANEVKGRTTYEKDLMSYFYFVLHGLPKYLKKHTGKKWKGIPKLVDSADELEPPKEEGGVARKRSALTPHVDNDKCEVTVPYASLAIPGYRQTTYCYSHDYHVLNEGFSFHGYAVTKEIEEKLNGRDDYGLMFYTLTGSAQGRGYPTFLIIFERRSQKGDTKVHFHRTHPSRSKDGDYNPIHNWTRVCYNWMAGNVNREHIKAQQGDLAFVQVNTVEAKLLDGKIVKDLEFNHQVNQYDSHAFEGPVDFAEYTKAAKSNILGYVKLGKETLLMHPEHDDVKIPAGTYAIHQCRSWEANPKGVWSLRID